MSRSYNKHYKKGKFLNNSVKAMKADRARISRRVLERTPQNYALWQSDTRKYDMIGEDTPDWFNKEYGYKVHNPFKYKFRTKKRTGKKIGRENKSYRKYYYGTTVKRRRFKQFNKKVKR